MLHINNLSYHIEGRQIFDNATAGIPTGHKVGLVGRNGSGKTTLLRLILGEIHNDGGDIQTPGKWRIGAVAQEAPGGEETLIEVVLAADEERARLLEEAETATEAKRISEIHLRLTDIEAHTAPSRAAAILAGLGFDEEAQNRACREFSGGWRMRVALGAALFAAPEILLLDEPTNYLDLEGALWLENFIRRYPHTILIVSHDRELLNRSVNAILHLRDGQLKLYTGGYDRFEKQRREDQANQLSSKKKQDDQRRHIQDFVDRFRAQANKARQAQARLKVLEKMKPIAAEIDNDVPPFSFLGPEKKLGDPLVAIEDAVIGYDPATPILKDLNLRIDINDRIALLGANGNGKSTFAKFVANRIQPFEGTRKASKKMGIGFFAQHQLDDLKPDQSAYDHISELMEGATVAQKRAKLGAIGFGSEKADTKADKLSGGEKARLLFAIAAFYRPHLFIFDEPTNHLDVDSREALIRAINDYEGAVILISHDRHLIEACVDRLWIVNNGTVTSYDGDLDSYGADCLRERDIRPNKKAANGGAPKISRAEQRRLKAEERSKMSPLRKQAQKFEKDIERHNKRIAQIDGRLSDGTIFENDPKRASELSTERGQLVKAKDEAEESWMEILEKLET